MERLADILIKFRGNQVATAKYLGVDRSLIKKALDNKTDFIVIDGIAFKEIGQCTPSE